MTDGSDQILPSVALSGDGRDAVVVWQGCCAQGAVPEIISETKTDGTVWLERVDPLRLGSSVNGAVESLSSEDQVHRSPTVVWDGLGLGFAWVNKLSSISLIRWRRYSDDLTSILDELELALSTGAQPEALQIVSTGDRGEFALLWLQSGGCQNNSAQRCVRLIPFNADGTEARASLELTAGDGEVDAVSPTLARGLDDSFIVVWRENSPPALVWQKLDAALAPVGEVTRLDTMNVISRALSIVAVDGGYMIAFVSKPNRMPSFLRYLRLDESGALIQEGALVSNDNDNIFPVLVRRSAGVGLAWVEEAPSRVAVVRYQGVGADGGLEGESTVLVSQMNLSFKPISLAPVVVDGRDVGVLMAVSQGNVRSVSVSLLGLEGDLLCVDL